MESLARIKDDPDFTFYESRLSSDIPEHSLGSYVRIKTEADEYDSTLESCAVHIKSEPDLMYDINMDAMTTVRHEFNFYHSVGGNMDTTHLTNNKLEQTNDFYGFDIPAHYDSAQLTNDASNCGSIDDPNMVRMCNVRLENFDTAFKSHQSSPLHVDGSVDLEPLHSPGDDSRNAFACEICRKTFSLLQHLRIHMHIHGHRSNTFECDICGNMYLQEGQLGAHIEACHTLVVVPEPPKPPTPAPELVPPPAPPTEVPTPTLPAPKQTFLCNICGQAYRQQRNLIAHKLVHTSQQEFKCELCPKTFNQMSSMKIHMNVHNSDKPYKCDKCDKSYTQMSNLKIHLTTHEGGRPFKCEVCGKTFSQVSSLKTHKHGHTGDKPHKCTICSKAYTQSSSLKVHMNIHNGHKPYKCEVCEKTFSDPSNFRKHKSTTHGI